MYPYIYRDAGLYFSPDTARLMNFFISPCSGIGPDMKNPVSLDFKMSHCAATSVDRVKLYIELTELFYSRILPRSNSPSEAWSFWEYEKLAFDNFTYVEIFVKS